MINPLVLINIAFINNYNVKVISDDFWHNSYKKIFNG